MNFLDQVKGGLIVSCQARPNEPFYAPVFMAEFAKAAYVAGAKGIRANGFEDIKAIKEKVPLPVIGIEKRREKDRPVYITPTGEEAERVARAGADIIAIDGTPRPRPLDSHGRSWTLKDLIDYIHDSLGLMVMADISTLEEGLNAEQLGADVLSTTLSGYTDYSPNIKGPDLNLVRDLCEKCHVPVIAEGRFVEPYQVRIALDYGAWACVVGKAITMPHFIAARFVEATEKPR